jgi:antitoxin (DNA-binding transcriptional repressor) of toxin-antitoxin stability system
MMAIGVDDAKTQLPKLLDRVSRGERFLITKHGRPVAAASPDLRGRSSGHERNQAADAGMAGAA